MKSNDRTMDILAIAMLLYSAWRAYDYMTNNLADVTGFTRIAVSVFFLAFTEGALLAWLHKGLPNATTSAQEFTAHTMVWIDFALSMVIGLGDLIVHNKFYQIDLTVIDPILFAAPWIAVVANIGAYLVYHTNDSDRQLEKAERKLEHAENQLEIEARHEALKLLRKGKQGLAQKLAPHYSNQIQGNVEGRTVARFTGQQQAQLPPTPSQDVPLYYNVETPAQLNGKTNHTGDKPNF